MHTALFGGGGGGGEDPLDHASHGQRLSSLVYGLLTVVLKSLVRGNTDFSFWYILLISLPPPTFQCPLLSCFAESVWRFELLDS